MKEEQPDNETVFVVRRLRTTRVGIRGAARQLVQALQGVTDTALDSYDVEDAIATSLRDSLQRRGSR